MTTRIARRTLSNLTRAHGHAERLLKLLIAAGDRGCMNYELWAVCHAVNSRISDLRARGFEIACTSEGGGKYRYVLRKESARASADTAQPAENVLQPSLFPMVRT